MTRADPPPGLSNPLLCGSPKAKPFSQLLKETPPQSSARTHPWEWPFVRILTMIQLELQLFFVSHQYGI